MPRWLVANRLPTVALLFTWLLLGPWQLGTQAEPMVPVATTVTTTPAAPASSTDQAPTRDCPNIILILADDLGYGDLGCYGQETIRTPRLDQMAREGLRFRQFYAGCTVCAPSRSVLMTGQHMGHTHVRGNASGDMSIQSLRDEDQTVAELLRKAGYTTALCGKWGLGDARPEAASGLPNRQGFDFFYGYLNQTHAHNYYPEFLWRNENREMLRNQVLTVGQGNQGGFAGGYATKRVDYSHDLIMKEALAFVQNQQDKPYFLYLAVTLPHANNEGTRGTGNGQEVPDYGPYADRDWPEPDKGQAAMISRLDADVGRLLDLVDRMGDRERTLVIFTSDNGPHNEGGHHPERFQPSGPLRGMKRELYEGGIRVPCIMRWPGTISANTITDHRAYFGDFLATAAELSGQPTPTEVDSISFVPTLRNQPALQRTHPYLYWEFYERGSKQAVRAGQWKAIRSPLGPTGVTQLFDLEKDLGESRDLAQEHPELVERLEAMMDEAHRPHPNWKARGTLDRQSPPPGDGRPRF